MLFTLSALLTALLFASATPASPDPVALFVEHCYNANRLMRFSKRPEAGSGWALASPEARAGLDLADNPEIKAWTLVDRESEAFMLLTIHERVLQNGGSITGGETRHTCQITYSGAESPDSIYERLVKVFDGRAGYVDPEGQRFCGYPRPWGWEQWLWSSMPKRESRDWKIDVKGNKQPICIILTAKRAYRVSEQIIIRLLVKQDAPKIIVLAFDRTFRPPEEKKATGE